jgi:uncharacterized protein YkwD
VTFSVRHTLIAIVAVIGALVIPSTAAAAGERPAPVASAASVAGQETTMRHLINQVRRQHGLKPLATVRALQASAARKNSRILACNSFSHTPCGDAFSREFRATGYYRGNAAIGENLAWGSGASSTPRAILRSWMASPAHRRNILTRSWRHQGIKLTFGKLGGHRVALWTNHFGRR